MPRIVSSATGIQSNVPVDPKLEELRIAVSGFQFAASVPSLQELAGLLPAGDWDFEEQVDLYLWIDVLNVLDAAIQYILDEHANTMLLIGESKIESLEDFESCAVKAETLAILKFTAQTLQNSHNKHVYASVKNIKAFLYAGDDEVSEAAVDVFRSLSLPVNLHRVTNPENHSSSFATEDFDMLVKYSRSWGTRSGGFGMLESMTTDMSKSSDLGEVHFSYYDDKSEYQTIDIRSGDIVSELDSDCSESETNEHKRRRVISSQVRSTTELFLSKCAAVPKAVRASFLAEIRMSRSFFAKESRIDFVRLRLKALVAVLHAHPSSELVIGFLNANSELCVELVDLLKSSIVDSSVVHEGKFRQDGLTSLVHSEVPFEIRLLSLQALTALSSRRDGTRLTTFLLELGVGKGQYLGFLPTLLRHSLSALQGEAAVADTHSTDEAMTVGLSFVELLLPEVKNRTENARRALQFLEGVLNLSSAVVSSPTGTNALVDCGLVPLILDVLKLDMESTLEKLAGENVAPLRKHFRFVSSQTVQILEACIVTHTNALSIFKDLKGIECLTTKLMAEVFPGGDSAMDESDITSSRRVLIFGLITAFTVVFHQEASTATTTPCSSAHIKSDSFTKILLEVLSHCEKFGGQIASLVATLLSDSMNNDPHIVHYIHESGIAAAFLGILDDRVPPVAEFVMAIPNVLFALSLTQDGIKAISEANPFPKLMRIFYTPKYNMPASRCLLNEMMAAVGTGLDDIMRNGEQLKPQILQALSDALLVITQRSIEVTKREEDVYRIGQAPAQSSDVESERSNVIQYVLNFGQLLEIILHCEDHCETFAASGGLERLIGLYEQCIPSKPNFMAQACSLSCISVSSLCFASTEDVIGAALKSLEQRLEPVKMLDTLVGFAGVALDNWDAARASLLAGSGYATDSVPDQFMYDCIQSVDPVAEYLQKSSIVFWATRMIANNIKAGIPRSSELSLSRRQDITKELSSPKFELLMERLSSFHQVCIFEVCRERVRPRAVIQQQVKNLRFRLRIVCPEGAVVRDGVEIDSCANLGNLAMGDIIDGTTRRINSSGVLRYKTSIGWVSEMTRGHGREPIAEVIHMWPADDNMDSSEDEDSTESILDTRQAFVGVMAKAQTTYTDLLTSISRAVLSTVNSRSMSAASRSANTSTLLKYLLRSFMGALYDDRLGMNSATGEAATCIGSAVQNLQACLFIDDRERTKINFPLLVGLGLGESNQEFDDFLKALSRVTRFGLEDCRSRLLDSTTPTYQRVGKSVASTFPSVLALLKKLLSTQLSSASSASVMARMKWKEVYKFLNTDDVSPTAKGGHGDDEQFSAESVVDELIMGISHLLREIVEDDRFVYLPPNIVHPITETIGDALNCLDEKSKKLAKGGRQRSSVDGDDESPNVDGQGFEPNEESIRRLMEMGFSREQAVRALEGTRSNQVEAAMDFALLSGPSVAETSQRPAAEPDPQGEDANGRNGEVEQSKTRFAEETEQWATAIPSLCARVLRSLVKPSARPVRQSLFHYNAGVDSAANVSDGDGEAEALTVVLCSFLLRFSKRKPDRQKDIVEAFYRGFSSLFEKDEYKGDTSKVPESDEAVVSAFCHAAVLIARAVPKSKLLLLKNGLVSKMIGITRTFVDACKKVSVAPMWLSPCLLLLVSLAEPIVAFDATHEHSPSNCDDYEHVQREHQSSVEALASTVNLFFTSALEAKQSAGGNDIDAAAKPQSLLDPASIPAFFPLLSRQMADDCLHICEQLLRKCEQGNVALPAAACQSVLSLLHALLRSPKISVRCLQKSLPETVIGLPSECRFLGNTGIVAGLFRRFLEDESTLLSAMETEIKSTVTKLWNKKGSNTGDETPCVKLGALLDATTPLLCRDPCVFVKALAVTVELSCAGTGSEAPVASLLPSTQRAKIIEKVNEAKKRAKKVKSESSRAQDTPKQKRSTTATKSPKKPGRRISFSKKGKREKSDNGKVSLDTPANRVISLLIEAIVSNSANGTELANDAFLWSGDLLEVLADLVLAVPSCASAVHNYRPHRSKSRVLKNFWHSRLEHALGDGPTPPKTFASFLLHVILPQDRWAIRNDALVWESQKKLLQDERPEACARKRKAYSSVKMSQSAARILVALTLRLGEGGKRVIGELVLALSGGCVSQSAAPVKDAKPMNLQPSALDALHAWGELCVGIIAPRSNGRNLEATGAVCVENAATMLEHGMAHALMFAMHFVRLLHPMSSEIYGSLLLPLEVLTRTSLTEAVKKHALKDGTKQDSVQLAIGMNHESLVFSDDEDFEDDDDSGVESRADDDTETSEDEDSDDDMDDEDDMEEDDSGIEEDNHDDDIVDDGDWDIDYNDPFEPNPPPLLQFDQAEEDGTDHFEENDEGWTRIEASGLGGMFFGGRVADLFPGGRRGGLESRGLANAANMIGTLLRNGGINGDALTELGIRIVHGGDGAPARIRAAVRGGNNEGTWAESFPTRASLGRTTTDRTSEGSAVGMLPEFTQRSPPDMGQFSFGRSGVWADLSSMEYVYGGPSSAGAGNNVSYDTNPNPTNFEAPERFVLVQNDLNLFPGGPALAASARASHSLHPLLGTISLPPANAIVSDLPSHGLRALQVGLRSTFGRGTVPNRAPDRRSIMEFGSSGRGLGLGDEATRSIPSVNEFRSAFEASFGQGVRAALASQEIESNPTEAAMSANADQESNERSSGENQISPNEPHDDPPGEPVPQDQDRSGDAEENSLVVELPELSLSESAPGAGSGGQNLPADPNDETAVSSQNVQGDDPAVAETDTDGDVANDNAAMDVDVEEADGEDDNGDELPDAPDAETNAPNNEVANDSDQLQCPPGFDAEVFSSLPRDMQLDCVNEYNATQQLAAELDGSTLDPAVLAELPEDMRREVIAQDRRQREAREQAERPADPSQAEDMDSASIIASMSPELRQEILLTCDDAVLNSLPPDIAAEAQILRERASAQRRGFDGGLGGSRREVVRGRSDGAAAAAQDGGGAAITARKRQKSGKLKVDVDRPDIVHLSGVLPQAIGTSDVKCLVRLLFLLSPVQPQRLLQRFFLNLCCSENMRSVLVSSFLELLVGNRHGSLLAVDSMSQRYTENDHWRRFVDKAFPYAGAFPPSALLGVAPEQSPDRRDSQNLLDRRRLSGGASSLAMVENLPRSVGGFGSKELPPVVSARLIETLQHMCKSPRVCVHALVGLSGDTKVTCFERLLELLESPIYTNSSGNLEQLLTLLESVVSPLSHISKSQDEEIDVSQRELEQASSSGKEYISVPRVVITQGRLQLLCGILRHESCRDAAFAKVNTIVRRLSRVEQNRGLILAELGAVAHALGSDALGDLRALRIRMDSALANQLQQGIAKEEMDQDRGTADDEKAGRNISSSITLSTSTSELRLLRVLQTLRALCNDSDDTPGYRKAETSLIVTEELVHLLRQLKFDELWDELSSCLKVVQVLEGIDVSTESAEPEETDAKDDASDGDASENAKKLRNSAAGMLTRFLPSMESFFVANASATRSSDSQDKKSDSPSSLALESLVGGARVMEFVGANKVVLNALIRNSPGLLEKGFRALVQVPRFRTFLYFDVKRQWFKTQVRRLRQQASRRHGSLRLQIHRDRVFRDAFHQIRLRNADEMRGRLHVTFVNEEGVDAGGLSREFFNILAKEMFNPMYGLFTSTEDGCTFQPDPNSRMADRDHLSYFRFVGRVVGKAVADGYLLDAHFTRSLYKHMLGIEPTHHDMEAIDPNYYGNLRGILEYNLEDVGLDDLTFSLEDHSFGRTDTIDLVPGGRQQKVTEANKEEYVRKVCQYRMTTAIKSQIKSFLDGFYELVSPELIAIFTPRELELLISGLPEIDVNDLKKNTDYVGWKVNDKEIQWFWNILFGLSGNEKAAFLQFVTGSSKVPLAGFAELQGMRGTQKFSVHKSASKGALMSAHTCFNSLDLPQYDSEAEMKDKLLLAITEGGGAFAFA